MMIPVPVELIKNSLKLQQQCLLRKIIVLVRYLFPKSFKWMFVEIPMLQQT